MNEQPNPDASKLEALQNARKQITRSLLLATAALGVIVFACYAWFVNNTSVTGSLGSVSAEGSSFELASVGGTSPYDVDAPDEYRVEGDDWPSDISPTGTSTGSKEAVLWRVSQSSNLNNYSGENNIEPGTSGSLQFYVVPKRPGTIRLTFQVELILLDGSKQVISEEIANQLVQGHLLFAYQKEGSTSTLLEHASQAFSLEFDSGNSTLVTLHWAWPLLLTNILDGKTAGIAGTNIPSTQSIIARMNTAPGDYFLYAENNTAVTTLPGFGDETPESSLVREYSNYYNNADQYIGQNVNGLVLRLTAVEG